jgi:hypothetical protein
VLTLCSYQAGPAALALGGGNVFWTDTAARSIGKVAVGGGEPVAIASDLAYPTALGVDGADIYWATTTSLLRADLDGGNPRSLVDDVPADPQHLRVHDADVYFGAGDWIYRIGSAGGPLERLFEEPFYIFGVAVDDDGLFWSGNTNIMRLSLGSTGPELLAEGTAGVGGIATDDQFIYWADGFDGGTVWRLAKDGGQPVALATDQASPQYPVVDGGSVYWWNAGSGAVMRVCAACAQ